MTKLIDPSYLAFPFRVGGAAQAPLTSRREQHVAEIIEQVLFTEPQERVFRPQFGAGVRALVFEPATASLAAGVRERLIASLTDALQGEVDPKSLDIAVDTDGERLFLTVGYRLAAFNRTVRQRFDLGGGALG
jgi:phage baseplate assembly protein W